MAIIPTPASLNGELQEIFRRLRNLENAPRSGTRSPDSVSGATAESLGFIDSTGTAQGVVRLSWVAPTVATDGKPLTPDRYEVYGRQTVDSLGYPVADPQWSLITTVDHPTTSAQAGPFSSQSTWEFRVRAISKKGQRSAFVYLTIVIALDATVPPVPSTPLVASSLRTLSMTWDGKDSTGLLMPAAFAFVEVHLSLTSGFTPDATTLVDTLTGPGTIPRVQLALGQVVYVKFRAKSRTGVLSAATPQASITILGITGPDIEANSITSNEVNTGLLTAVMVRGDVMTSSLGTGARFRLSAADGLKLYNSANVNTVWLDAATGNALITGIFRTAATGIRVEINNAMWTGFSGVRLYNTLAHTGYPEIKSNTGSGAIQITSGEVVTGASGNAELGLYVGGDWYLGSTHLARDTKIENIAGDMKFTTGSGKSFYLQSSTGTYWSQFAFTAGVLTWENPNTDLIMQVNGSYVLDYARSSAVQTFAIRRNTVDRITIGANTMSIIASSQIIIDSGSTVFMPHAATAASSSAPNAFFTTNGELRKTSYVISAKKYKREMVPLKTVLTVEDVLALVPYQYKMRPEMVAGSDHPERVFYGFIADDAHKNPKLHPVLEYEHGDVDRFQYEKWVGPQQLVLIEHERRINEQAAEIAELRSLITTRT